MKALACLLWHQADRDVDSDRGVITAAAHHDFFARAQLREVGGLPVESLDSKHARATVCSVRLGSGSKVGGQLLPRTARTLMRQNRHHDDRRCTQQRKNGNREHHQKHAPRIAVLCDPIVHAHIVSLNRHVSGFDRTRNAPVTLGAIRVPPVQC